MFFGEGLIYVRHEHRKGTSNNGNDYEFANVTLSDGLESYKLPLDFKVLGIFESFKRGDTIDIKIDIDVGYNNRVNVLIVDASLSQKIKAG